MPLHFIRNHITTMKAATDTMTTAMDRHTATRSYNIAHVPCLMRRSFPQVCAKPASYSPAFCA